MQPKRAHMVFRIVSRAMFGLPTETCKELDEQLIDGLMLSRVWLEFIRRQIAEWQLTMHTTLAIAM